MSFATFASASTFNFRANNAPGSAPKTQIRAEIWREPSSPTPPDRHEMLHDKHHRHLYRGRISMLHGLAAVVEQWF